MESSQHKNKVCPQQPGSHQDRAILALSSMNLLLKLCRVFPCPISETHSKVWSQSISCTTTIQNNNVAMDWVHKPRELLEGMPDTWRPASLPSSVFTESCTSPFCLWKPSWWPKCTSAEAAEHRALLGPFLLKPFQHELHKNRDSKSIVRLPFTACGPVPRTRQFCSEGHEQGPINHSALGLLLFAPNLTTNWCSMEARTSSETQIRLTPSHTASGDRITPQNWPLSYTTPNPALALGLVFPTPWLVLSIAFIALCSVSQNRYKGRKSGGKMSVLKK